MQLPAFIVAYATALLSAPWRFTLVYLSVFSSTSHDFLTRGIKQRYQWKTLLGLLLNNKLLSEGYLIIDETDVDKSFAQKIPCLGWIYSHRKNKYIFGLHIVVVVWTNTKITLPLAWKIYKKDSGITKIDLAIQLIHYCLFTLRISSKAWLFDSFYASETLLKYSPGIEQALSKTPNGIKLLKLITDRQNMLRDAWLTATKYKRPGLPVGLPLDEATSKSDEMGRSIDSLLQK